jgi:hypothetical protein
MNSKIHQRGKLTLDEFKLHYPLQGASIQIFGVSVMPSGTWEVPFT